MAQFSEIRPEEFVVSPFKLIGEDWMLIAAEKAGRVNAMTASWGGLGVMWRMNVAYVVIRPQRFTKEFVDGSEAFSLNFFGESFREQLSYFGSVSGRDEDKVAKSGFSVAHSAGAPYFEQADTVLTIRKLFAQPYRAESFIDAEPLRDCYPAGDFHTMYIGEVTGILRRK